ncbi:MAG: glycosyltransferase [Crocinitomicaceae bacterium]|nr:glycosyltransferase [Crocinitomicaceae bacterium]
MQVEQLSFSIIVPVFNRPEETKELLESLSKQTDKDFEVIIVEDGSTTTSEAVVNEFSDQLSISYYFKENSGPGDSRNYGMQRAKGNYFLILDSDCILPTDYFEQVKKSLSANYVDCFGGIDTAADSFTPIQKAINYSMTSFLTTGGIRGSSEKLGKFHPRSFNMGISKKAFEATNGYKNIYIGEDIDLSVRLWKAGFDTRLFQNVAVFHKRRIDWTKFYKQVNQFGSGRPILNKWYPEYAKLTFYFPALFLIGFCLSVLFTFFGYPALFFLFIIYFVICFADSFIKNNSLETGFQSISAIAIQFFGYGSGFIKTYYRLHFKKLPPEEAFPTMFIRKK